MFVEKSHHIIIHKQTKIYKMFFEGAQKKIKKKSFFF